MNKQKLRSLIIRKTSTEYLLNVLSDESWGTIQSIFSGTRNKGFPFSYKIKKTIEELKEKEDLIIRTKVAKDIAKVEMLCILTLEYINYIKINIELIDNKSLSHKLNNEYLGELLEQAMDENFS